MSGASMRVGAAVGVGLVSGVALAVLTRGLGAPRALSLLLLVAALAVAALVPLVAVSGRGRTLDSGLGALGGLALAAVGAAAVRGGPVLGVLLAQLYLLLHGAALYGLSRSLSDRRGEGAGLVAGLALGFALVGAPYVTGDLVAALPRGLEDAAISALLTFSPSLALPGTFLDRDPLRESVLYERFTPVQDLAWSYASVPAALAAQAVLAALALGASALVSKLPRRTPAAAAAVVLAVFLLAPQRAEAQIFGDGGSGGNTVPEGEIGPMNTKVRLGYIVPFIDGNFKVNGFTPDRVASRIDVNNDLSFKLQYCTPVFEVDVGWQGAGRVWIEYWELAYKADFLSPSFEGVTYKNLKVPSQEIGIVDYRFRTISLNGRLDIPVLDFVTLMIVATTRYVHWENEIRVPKTGQKDVANTDYIFPAIGPGVDVFVTDKIYVYGSVQWLDLDLGFGKKHNVITHYREAHGGLRLELLESAHIGVEFYILEVGLKNKRDSYRQRIIGPRIWVEVQF